MPLLYCKIIFLILLGIGCIFWYLIIFPSNKRTRYLKRYLYYLDRQIKRLDKREKRKRKRIAHILRKQNSNRIERRMIKKRIKILDILIEQIREKRNVFKK
jgi:hypothetical protein